MRLRGYDEYEVTLGDEMRGERASLGKSLEDAERDLRIKAHIIRAIEDCDLDGFPNDSVVAGYVRSYSRYLGLDPEDCYRRFCAESGFRSPAAGIGAAKSSQTGLQTIVSAGTAIGGGLTQSRFAVQSAPVNFGARISLGGLTSALMLMLLIAGLGYGGYALLQDIQRVGFAPLSEAPEVVAEAPLITPPTVDGGLLRRPDAEAYAAEGALAAAPVELMPPVLPSRDGPIADIDPATSGVYRVIAPEPAPEEQQRPDPRFAGPAWGEVQPVAAAPDGAAAGATGGADAAIVSTGPPTVTIYATSEAWVRIRDGETTTIFEGTLQAGDQFQLPERVTDPLLRVGNAGGVYLLLDGAAYGPVGPLGSVVKNFSLRAETFTAVMPEVSAAAIGVTPSGPLQRAEAEVSQ